jgi:PKD repeat protein
LDVLIQPEASFIADPVCSGDEMVFINKSTASVGKMSYAWEFGDNSNSTLENPKKRYSVKQTTAYNVTLVVNLQGGCSDSITKAVTVQELPRTCDFVASPDYQFAFFGLSLEPMDDVSVAGGQAGIDYTWTVAGLGAKSSKDVNAKVSYDLQQDGLYTVTIKSVVRATGCECSKTKQVVMDRAAVQNTFADGLQVYPNPVQDQLWVKVPQNYSNAKYVIWNSMGAKIMGGAVEGSGAFSIGLPAISAGMYTLELIGENRTEKVKFMVTGLR